MSDPVFGIAIQRITNDPRPAIVSDMSIIGLVGTAPDADTDDFPINTPVMIYSDDSVKLTALGATGTLPDAIAGINDQLGEFQVAAKVIVVRVAEGEDADATITNLVGNSGAKTGIHALTLAGPEIGMIPRLVAVPGYTSQHEVEDAETTVSRATKSGGNTGGGTLTLADPAYGASAKAGVYQVRCVGGAKSASAAAKAGGNAGGGSIGSLTADDDAAIGAWRVVCQVVAADGGTFAVYRPDGTFDGIAVVGSAYNSAHGLNFTLADSGTDFAAGDEFVVTVAASVPSNGGVFSVRDPDGTYLADATEGVAYDGTHIKFQIDDVGTDFAIGDGFDVTVVKTGGEALANPVCAALPAVLNKLLAHAVVDGPATTQQAFTDWRETIQSDRIIPVETAVKVGVSASVKPGSPRVLGIAARRDHEYGGRPFHSWANQAVAGIVGPNRPIDFSLTDGATEGQTILSQNGGVIIRGEMGVESAIASGGFVYIGTDTCSEDVLWQFYNVTRGRDYIHLMFLRTLRGFLGKRNIDLGTITDILDTMKFALRDLEADGDILPGWKVGFKRDQNSPEQLRLGKFVVDFACEEPPVLRFLGLRSARNRPSLELLLDDLMSQIDVAA